MARIRTIKPEFWTHEDLSSLPEATHMLAAALLNHSDDEGYFNSHPGLVKAACSPLREPSVSIHESLILLEKCGYIKTGRGEDGKRYGKVITFDDHQRVNRPTPSKIKALHIEWEDSLKTHGGITEHSPPERKGKERKGSEVHEPDQRSEPRNGTRLPAEWTASQEDLDWAKAERPDIIAEREISKFRDYWTSKSGKEATKLNWSATWRNWIRNARTQGAGLFQNPVNDAPRKRRELGS